jgi:hypothetical protein
MATSGYQTSVPKPANQGGHAPAGPITRPTLMSKTTGPNGPMDSTILYSSQPNGIGGAKPTSGSPIK